MAAVKFGSEAYVAKRFPNSLKSDCYSQLLLKKIVQFCENMKFDSDSKKMLEYGNGPHPVYALGWSPVAYEIVLAEYEESHREFVRNWLNKESNAYDWSFYFSHVAELLGKDGDGEASNLEERLRRKVVAITSCDITKDQCIAEDYRGPYDIVFSSVCIDTACKTLQDHKNAMKKLVAMVKQGGYFVLVTTIREKAVVGFYIINNVKIFEVALKREDVLETGSECGLTLLEEESFPAPQKGSNADNITFFAWKKISN